MELVFRKTQKIVLQRKKTYICVAVSVFFCNRTMEPNSRTTEYKGTARAYIYTIWLDNEAIGTRHIDKLIELYETTNELKYFVGQFERGRGEFQRLHLQLYVEFGKPAKGKRLFTLLGLGTGDAWYKPVKVNLEKWLCILTPFNKL